MGISHDTTARGRRRARRTVVALATGAAALAALAPVASPPAAQADDANTLTVVGTSDVFDSFLVQNVIEPGFQAAYPQYDLQYVSRGTGAAIALARTGAASAMIVHAAALENQFVADGYSAEPYGRAIFWGDYVLLGPASDPAAVEANAPTDIVTAYERIASSGAAGTAEFVSRGGTPGTTVQEHAIWALTDDVTTCTVSDANGGGESPSTVTGPCPSPIPYPTWYHATGQTQGPNILTGDACNGFASDACYVFTDRGTFNYLDSTAAISDLHVVTRDNDVPGQLDLLVNSFHAYALNPAKFTGTPSVNINSAAATAFLDWLTAPANQQTIGEYLDDEGDPPFLPSAAPALTVDTPASGTVRGGNPVTIGGTLTNVVPGTPPLNDEDVYLVGRPAGGGPTAPAVLATTTTGPSGGWSFTYTPRRSYDYTVATTGITKIENDALNPVFGDLLAPTSTSAGTAVVQGVVSGIEVAKAGARGRTVVVTGDIAPAVVGQDGRVALWGARGDNELRRLVVQEKNPGATAFTLRDELAPGKWRLQARYLNPGVVLEGRSAVKRVTIG